VREHPERAAAERHAEPDRVNLSAAESAFASDPEFHRELARMFLEDAPSLLTSIRTAIDSREAPDLKLAAHTLKGSTGVFKDQAAFDAAFQMERIGRDASWEDAQSAWDTLTHEVERLTRDLSKIVSSKTNDRDD
jgi:HPt (histidine-containing phosphotransfer) domain-containing protein